MKTRLLICLTLLSLYTTGCLSGTASKNRTHSHTSGTRNPSIPWRSPSITGKTKLRAQRTDTSQHDD